MGKKNKNSHLQIIISINIHQRVPHCINQLQREKNFFQHEYVARTWQAYINGGRLQNLEKLTENFKAYLSSLYILSEIF